MLTLEGKITITDEEETDLRNTIREEILDEIDKFGLRVDEVETVLKQLSPGIYLRVIRNTVDDMSGKLNDNNTKVEISKIEAIRHIMEL